MATQVKGGRAATTGFPAAMYYYTVSTNNETTYTLTLYGGYNLSSKRSGAAPIGIKCNMIGTSQTTKTYTGSYPATAAAGDHTLISSYTWSWSKAHSSQSVSVSCQLQEYGASGYVTVSTASQSFTIPARTSYTVSYNANGGSGAPSAQTKWHGENLTLSSSKPTKSGYTFKGWATSTDNASDGTVDYASGATYSSNAAVTLYAVWELTYSKPSITNLSVERCDQDGMDNDEGGYASVTFDWSVFQSASARYYGGSTYPYSSNAVDTCTVTVGTFSATPSLSGASGTETVVIGNGSFDTDTQYSASVEITDTQTVATSHTTTVTGTLAKSSFPMDFNATGEAVGFFMPAPDSGSGVYVGGNVEATGDVTASGAVAAGGSVSVPNGFSFFVNNIDRLFVRPGETIVCRGGCGGFLTGGQKYIHFYPIIKKSLALVTSATVDDISGGIRFGTGGYVNNVGDGTSWKDKSGISFGISIYDEYVMVDLISTSTFKKNGTTTAVENNSPVFLGGDITITFH